MSGGRFHANLLWRLNLRLDSMVLQEVAALLKEERRELLIETIVIGEEWTSLFNEADCAKARATLAQLQRR